MLSTISLNSMLLLWLILDVIRIIFKSIILSKYYEKSNERLFIANGFRMKVKYKLTNAHVCQYGVCFKIPYVLIGNVTNRVILGMPFIFYIYLLFIENGSITTNTFK